MTSQLAPTASAASPAGATQWSARLRMWVPWCAAIVIVIGLTVLAGWALNIRALKSVLPHLVTMKVNTALELLLLAAALLAVHLQFPGRRAALWVSVGVVAVLGLMTQAEYLFDVDLRVDNFLFVDRDPIRYPGRNAPGSIWSFIVVGVAFILLDLRRAALAQLLLLLTLAIPMATLGGYLYRAPGMYGDVSYPVLAVHTAVALTLLCLGGLFALPDRGMMSVVVSRSTAGYLARRLLPLAVGVPGLTGLAVLAGEQGGLYSGAFASALLVSCCSVLFGAAVWWTATLLWHTERAGQSADLARREAQTALTASEARYRQLAEERAELLDRERESRARAEAASKSKDQFLAVLSHELRTPLTPVLATLTHLEKRPALPTELTSEIGMIRRNVELQLRLVDDLLDLTRIGRGKIELRCEAVDLHRLVHAAAAIVGPEAEAKRLRITLQLDAPRPTVWGDPARLQQVLANLIQNAIRFTPDDGKAIEVHTVGEGSSIRLEVIDRGVGIDPQVLPRLFSPFEQGERTLTRGTGGLGLGLAISKSLVEMHGGTLVGASEGRGRGATFSLRLATIPEPVAPSSAGTAAVAIAAADPLLRHPPTILLVEDHDDTRRVIARLLKTLGCEVKTAASLAQAVESLEGEAGRIDLLVSDIGLPDGSGLDLMRCARQKGIRGIALSGFGQADDIRRSREAGFETHLVKPINFQALEDLIFTTAAPA